MSKRSKRSKMLRAAARAPAGVRDAVASKWTARNQRRYDERKLGTFGAASLVRIIVKEGKPMDHAKATII